MVSKKGFKFSVVSVIFEDSKRYLNDKYDQWRWRVLIISGILFGSDMIVSSLTSGFDQGTFILYCSSLLLVALFMIISFVHQKNISTGWFCSSGFGILIIFCHEV